MPQRPKHRNSSMYEERLDKIISTKDGRSNFRIARFLKPLATNISLVTTFPHTPFVYQVFFDKNLEIWPFQVHFTGWNKPQKEWGSWYYRLVGNHGTNWLKAGILDAIHSSIHEIPCNKELVLGVSEFWCPKTNTFVFPWGEATITLEDVMVLGGFPVLGGSIHKGIEGNVAAIVNGLKRVKREISNEVVTHSAWMEHFMEEEEEGEIDYEEGEFEHVAFLALWLSRFVFPDHDQNVIDDHVFPIAAHLSTGTPLCIAPTVLATLYFNLTTLVEKASDPCFHSELVSVPGLFQILQLWVCERFPVFAEKLAKPLNPGDPRAARWDNVQVQLDLPYVRSSLMSGGNFRWRPYAHSLEGWELLPFYEDKEQILGDFMDFPCSELPSYAWFCLPSILDGIEGKETYNPHRVAMQLGYDQDLPGEFCVSNSFFDQVGFVVPARDFQPGTTTSYYNWWKDSISCHKEAVSNALRLKMIGNQFKEGTSSLEEGEIYKVSEISGNKADDHDVSGDLDNMPLAMRAAASRRRSSNKLIRRRSPSSAHIQHEPSNYSDRDHVPLALGIEKFVKAKAIDGRVSTVEARNPHRRRSSQTEKELRSPTSDTVKSWAHIQHESSNSYDRDHVPLAFRLEKIVKAKAIEHCASTINAGNPHRRRMSHTGEELRSPTSVSVIQITSKRTNLLQTRGAAEEVKSNVGSKNTKGARKEALEVRVDKLERDVAKLGAAKFSPRFSGSS